MPISTKSKTGNIIGLVNTNEKEISFTKNRLVGTFLALLITKMGNTSNKIEFIS